MESTSQFDLEKAIQNWLTLLCNSEVFTDGDLMELEDHLRTAIEYGLEQNLEEKLAFEQATTQVGEVHLLIAQYREKNRPKMIWERITFFCVGVLSFLSGALLYLVLFNTFCLGIYYGLGLRGIWYDRFSLVVLVLGLLSWAYGLYVFYQERKTVFRRALQKLYKHPYLSGVALITFLFLLGTHAFISFWIDQSISQTLLKDTNHAEISYYGLLFYEGTLQVLFLFTGLDFFKSLWNEDTNLGVNRIFYFALGAWLYIPLLRWIKLPLAIEMFLLPTILVIAWLMGLWLLYQKVRHKAFIATI